MRTHRIPIDKVCLCRNFGMDDQWICGGDQNPVHEIRLMVAEFHPDAGFSIGLVPHGYKARKVSGGPLVEGPWAFAAKHAVCISAHGLGTSDEIAEDRRLGLLVEVEFGDVLAIGEDRFEVVNDRFSHKRIFLRFMPRETLDDSAV